MIHVGNKVDTEGSDYDGKLLPGRLGAKKPTSIFAHIRCFMVPRAALLGSDNATGAENCYQIYLVLAAEGV